jgi:hypothetical protein
MLLDRAAVEPGAAGDFLDGAVSLMEEIDLTVLC